MTQSGVCVFTSLYAAAFERLLSMTTVDSSIEVANEKTLQVHIGVANAKLSMSTCEPWIYATDRHPIRAHRTATLVLIVEVRYLKAAWLQVPCTSWPPLHHSITSIHPLINHQSIKSSILDSPVSAATLLVARLPCLAFAVSPPNPAAAPAWTDLTDRHRTTERT